MQFFENLNLSTQLHITELVLLTHFTNALLHWERKEVSSGLIVARFLKKLYILTKKSNWYMLNSDLLV